MHTITWRTAANRTCAILCVVFGVFAKEDAH
jgi:hypothetical protein